MKKLLVVFAIVVLSTRNYFLGYWGMFGVAHQLPFEYNPE
jgi:hypothetical protein